jgi:hypothetical protein
MAKRGPHARTLAQQSVALNRLPLTTHIELHRNRLRWEGTLQPTPSSDTYLVQVEYTGAGRPDVKVLSPDLDVPHNKLPHTFDDGDLCLHFPGEWNASHLIAYTIVPWASEWLLHYELWRATGEWLGGGHEPGSDATK